MALIELLHKNTDLLTQDFEQSIAEGKLFPFTGILAEEEQDNSDAESVIGLLADTHFPDIFKKLEQVFSDQRFVVFERAKDQGNDDYADTLYDELQAEYGGVFMYFADLTYERIRPEAEESL